MSQDEQAKSIPERSPVVRLASNVAGRDFVMGDLHGEIMQLRQALDRVSFNPICDRLFSVGDLIDRGPHSLECLRLLNEPWFFPVKGNHEAMMIFYLLSGEGGYWMSNSGTWYLALSEAEQSEVLGLTHQALQLPYVYVVGSGEQRFQVVHAELEGTNAQLEEPWTRDTYEIATWARRLAGHYQRHVLRHKLGQARGQPLRFAEAKGHIDYKPIRRDLSLTFCGHTRVARPGLWQSHYFLDTGCGYPDGHGLTLLPVDLALSAYAEFSQWKFRERGGV